MRKIVAGIVAAALPALCMVVPGLSQAQTWPDKPVRVVVPYPAGGGVDVPFRFITQLLQNAWGKPVVVENRPGGNLYIAMENVKSSPADGYSLVTTDSQSMSINPALYSNMPYDPEKDFAHVGAFFQFSCLLVVPPGLAANNVREFVAMVRAKPGEYRYGSSGNGSVQHLIIEEFLSRAGGLKMQQIPYKGVADIIQGILTGSVEAGSSAYVAANALLKAGKLKALGIGSDQRLPQIPDVATFKEQGVDYNCPSWIGLAAPAGTPKAVVDKIGAEMSKVVTSKEFAEKFVGPLGIEVVNITGERLTPFLRNDRQVYASVVKRLNIPKQ